MMGGNSAERLISLESGQAVLSALKDSHVDAYAFDTRDQNINVLTAENFNRVFIMLHGRGGEDGSIQGALESISMPYTGSGILGSALAMDKIRSKQIWISMGLATPDFIVLEKDTDWQMVVEKLGLPLMVKPAREGSSFGATKVKDLDVLQSAFEAAFAFDEQVIAECWIEGGGEYTIPILGDEVFPMIQLKTPREFYDYEAKYESDTTEYICPCGLGVEKEDKIGQLALKAFKALACEGWGRVDVILDADHNVWLIEANTVPGMTNHSLVPMGAKHKGIEFDELVLNILADTFNDVEDLLS